MSWYLTCVVGAHWPVDAAGVRAGLDWAMRMQRACAGGSRARRRASGTGLGNANAAGVRWTVPVNAAGVRAGLGLGQSSKCDTGSTSARIEQASFWFSSSEEPDRRGASERSAACASVWRRTARVRPRRVASNRAGAPPVDASVPPVPPGPAPVDASESRAPASSGRRRGWTSLSLGDTSRRRGRARDATRCRGVATRGALVVIPRRASQASRP